MIVGYNPPSENIKIEKLSMLYILIIQFVLYLGLSIYFLFINKESEDDKITR